MLIYIFLLIIIFLLDIIIKPNTSSKRRKRFLGLCMLLFLMISMFRDVSVGADTKQFYDAFTIIGNRSLELSFEYSRYEKGFILLCKLLSIVSNNPQILIIITSLFINCVVFKFIENNSDDVFLSVLIYFCMNIFSLYMTAMRQAIAIAILMIGYDKFYKNDKKILYILFVILASLFHSSALLFLILLVIPKNKVYNNKMLFITIALSIIVYIFPGNIFALLTSGSKYNDYKNLEYFSGSEYAGYFNFLIYFIELIFSYLFSRKYINKNHNINMYLYILSLNMIISCLSIKISIFVRTMAYFDIFNIIYLPYIIKNISNDNNKKIVYMLFITFIILYWLVVSIYRPEWYGVIPYKFMF